VSGNQSEDDAWRAIVENYGDRPEVAPQDHPEPEPPPEPFRGNAWDDDEGYVPPPPPPLPHPTPTRMAAWLGIFGAPAVLLVALVAGFALPIVIGYLLVAWFLGGFAYLVLTMQRGPRDPGDDGARI
jgi:hypothetical protein